MVVFCNLVYIVYPVLILIKIKIMKTLYIIASPRGEMSKSIEIWNYVTEKIGWEIITVDVHKENIPYITFPVIAYNYGFGKYEELSIEDKRIADLQSKYISKLMEADNLVIATPMWNFWMPAALKSWFDLVCKINETFEIKDWNYGWLVKNLKNTIVVWARWGKYLWTQAESYDILTPQINWLLGFIWISPKNFWLEWMNVLPENEIAENISELKNNINTYLNS